MITIRENFSPLSHDSIRYIDMADVGGKRIIDLIPTDIVLSDCIVQVIKNGKELDDLDILNTEIQDLDVFTFRVVPKVAAVGWFIVQLIVSIAVGYAIQYAINALIGTGKEKKKKSATYTFDTAQTTTENGTPIPIFYGERLISGHVLNVVNSTEKGRKSKLSVLLSLGEGGVAGWESIGGITTDQDEIFGEDLPTEIYIDETPIREFMDPNTPQKDVTVSTRMGTSQQAPIVGFADTPVYSKPFTLELLHDAVFTYVTSNKIGKVRIRIQFPSGLFKASASGGVHAAQVGIRVQYICPGDLNLRGDTTYQCKESSTSSFYFEIDIKNLPKAVTTFYISRYTDDHIDSLTTTDKSFLAEIVEYTVDDNFSYPNKALLGITAIASEKLQGAMPNITILAKGIKIRVYTSSTAYTVKWSDNPAWVIFDILTNNRYGLGDFISIENVDINSFIDAASYYDELVPDGQGDVEKRSVVDIVIDQRQPAWDWIYDIVQTAQSTLLYVGGRYVLRPDIAAEPVMMFNPSNMYDLKIGYTAKSDRTNYTEISYYDREIKYRHEYVVELDTDLQSADLYNAVPRYVKETLELKGITRRSQAHRIGVYRVNSNKLSTRYATWSADVAAIRCEPGDVVEIGHDVTEWGLASGRVVAATSDSIQIDTTVIVEFGKVYAIRVWDGTTFQERTVQTLPGTYSRLGIIGAWTSVPTVGNVYSFGLTNAVVQRVKIIDMKLKSNYTVDFNAIEYDPLVFSDEIVSIPGEAIDFGFNPLEIPPPVTDLVVSPKILISPDGSSSVYIDVSFSPPLARNYDHAKVWIKDSVDAIWELTLNGDRVYGKSVSIRCDHDLGDILTIAVSSAAISGAYTNPGNAPFKTFTLNLSTERPAAVEDFTVNRYADTLSFNWSANAENNVAGYEIRQGSSWASATVVSSMIAGTSFETSLFYTADAPIITSYMIKAINTYNNYSEDESVISIQIDPKLDRNIVLSNTYRQNDWPGTYSNLSQVGTAGGNYSLQLTSNSSPGVYTTPTFDVGAVIRNAVSVNAELNQIDSIFTWAVATFTWESTSALTRTWEGLTTSDHLTAMIDWRYGDSLPLTTAYTGFIITEKSFRYAQFRVTLISDSPDFGGAISQFGVLIDVPDIIASGTQQIAGTDSIMYAKPFNAPSSIIRSVIVTNLQDGEYVTVDDIADPTFFTVTVHNSDGSPTTDPRTIEWIAKGY